MPVAESGSLKIAYDDRGNGEPTLLFLPGWCASREAFVELAGQLASRHRTLALDWRGHGGSSPVAGDFGNEELVADALAVIAASRAEKVVPVATAHAGWVAIELARRLGPRIPKLILVDWIVTDAPPPFLAGLRAMQDTARAFEVRDQLFASWTHGVDHPGVLRFVREDMGSHSPEMWARGAREIRNAYEREGSPLEALAAFQPPVPTLHLYAQPTDEGFWAAQQSFAEKHGWFTVQRLEARSHFPTIEVPARVEEAMVSFLSQL